MGVCSFRQPQRLKTAYRAPFIYPVSSEDAYAVAETMDTQLFDFGGHDVRVVLDSDREPWFVLKDVCEVLELDSPHKVAERLEDYDRNSTPVIDRLGRSQGVTTVNESGLYDVIFQSHTAGRVRSVRASIPDAWPSRRQ